MSLMIIRSSIKGSSHMRKIIYIATTKMIKKRQKVGSHSVKTISKNYSTIMKNQNEIFSRNFYIGSFVYFNYKICVC